MILIERKDVSKAKLTIAHDGQTRLKIPLEFNEKEVLQITERAEQIVIEKGPQKKTLRLKLTLNSTPKESG